MYKNWLKCNKSEASQVLCINWPPKWPFYLYIWGNFIYVYATLSDMNTYCAFSFNNFSKIFFLVTFGYIWKLLAKLEFFEKIIFRKVLGIIWKFKKIIGTYEVNPKILGGHGPPGPPPTRALYSSKVLMLSLRLLTELCA